MDQLDTRQDSSVSRRTFLRATGLSIGGLALTGPVLAACKSSGGGGGSSAGTLNIGFVSPRTGPAAGFGEPDGYVLSLARKAFADGITAGGKKYDVKIIDKDGQSNPQRSAQVANDLINCNIDLMLTTSTPEIVNPVSDACEAAGVPCVSTVVPWEAWYFGRGGKPTDKKAFKFVYHFCFGVQQFANAYTTMWPEVPTNKKVGVMWPNDADGNAIRESLGPLLKKAGYTIIDPGAYTDGTNDYSSQIERFKSQNCEIFNTFPIPPDFATFWQQAAQQGYKPKIAQIAKTGLFPSQIEALGKIGVGLASGAYWTPTYPYTSSLTKITSKQLGDGYESTIGKQWNQQLGPAWRCSTSLPPHSKACRTRTTRSRWPTRSAACPSTHRSANSSGARARTATSWPPRSSVGSGSRPRPAASTSSTSSCARTPPTRTCPSRQSCSRTRDVSASTQADEHHDPAAGAREPLLACTGVTKNFGKLRVLDAVDLGVGAGEAVGVVGPNGAGKTTLLNVLAGSISPDRGTVRLDGQDVTGLRPERRCRLGVGRAFQIPRPFGGMTVLENVLVGASYGAGLSRSDGYHRCIEVLALCSLIDVANRRSENLGLLHRKRLELARAVATNPKVLLLDEIGGGLTDAEADELVETVRVLHRSGISIVWIEHIVHVLLQCRRSADRDGCRSGHRRR